MGALPREGVAARVEEGSLPLRPPARTSLPQSLLAPQWVLGQMFAQVR